MNSLFATTTKKREEKPNEIFSFINCVYLAWFWSCIYFVWLSDDGLCWMMSSIFRVVVNYCFVGKIDVLESSRFFVYYSIYFFFLLDFLCLFFLSLNTRSTINRFSFELLNFQKHQTLFIFTRLLFTSIYSYTFLY